MPSRFQRTYLGRGQERKQTPFYDLCETQWCARHHVAASKDNSALPKFKRTYFDLVPNVTFTSSGDFAMPGSVPTHRAEEASSEAEVMSHKLVRKAGKMAQLGREVASSPVFWTPCKGELPLEDGGGTASGRPSKGSGPPQQRQSAGASSRKGASASLRRSNTKQVSPFADPTMAPLTKSSLEFAAWCVSKYKHLVCLWCELDSERKMLLPKSEFIKGMRELQYEGDLEQLWGILDRDASGSISFLEFCPEDALELAQFKSWVSDRFGTATAALGEMDRDGDGYVSFSEFSAFCKRHGYPSHLERSFEILYQVIAAQGASSEENRLTERELGYIDAWDPPRFLFVRPDHQAKMRFKSIVLSRYRRNPILAWRHALNKDSSMRVSYEDFLAQCAALASRGILDPEESVETLTAVYCSLDSKRCGWFGLEDWDTFGYRLLCDFTIWAKAEFGSVRHFVRNFEEEGLGMSLDDFRLNTKSLGLEQEETAALHEALRSDAGSVKTDRVFQWDVKFLDEWDPEKEKRDTIVWESIGSQRMLVEVKRIISDANMESMYGSSFHAMHHALKK
mmetsp:Transcript_40433/g.106704  ORF Transcript_40433/g.106704 Transcript_40433/m.106704 type:complete len:565 (+) Transcript_40433:3-1697(+)